MNLSLPVSLNFRRGLLALALAALAPLAAFAHHPFGAQYDGNKPVRLIGKLTRIDWTNPHSYFYLEVTNAKGEIVEWTLETAAPGALSRRGFKKGDIKIGDTLIVDGFLAKSGAKLADARRVTLPDGRKIYGGTSGDGGPGDDRPQPKEPAVPDAPGAKAN